MSERAQGSGEGAGGGADVPVTIEVYARALGHLLGRRGEPAASVLGALGIAPEAFWQAEQRFTGELEQALARRKGLVAMAFATALGKAMREAGLLDPRAPERPLAQDEAPVAGRWREVPSFLHVQDAASAVFSSPTPPAAFTPSAPLAAPPTSRRQAPVSLAATDETAEIALSLFTASPLPFVHGSAAPAPVIASARPEPRFPASQSGDTMFLAEVLGPPPSAATPFGASAPAPPPPSLPPLPSMAIGQFAALSVEVARHPADAAAVLARYGITVDAYRRAEASYAMHLAHNPALRAKYDELTAHLGRQGG